MDRRHFIAGLAGGLTGLSMTGARSHAGDSLTLFIPSTLGSGWDRIGQAIAASLQETGIVAEPDFVYQTAGPVAGLVQFTDNYRGAGDTLMVCGLGMIGPTSIDRAHADILDLTPIASLTTEHVALAVSTDSTIFSLDELLAATRANPERIVYTGASVGGTGHLLVGMLGRHIGIPGRLLTYRGFTGGVGAANAVISGSATCLATGLSEMLPELGLGRLRPLAVTSPQRLPGVNIPTFAEQGLDIELSNWRAVVAPSGLTPAQKAWLCEAVDRMVVSGAWRSKLFQYNWTSFYLTGDAFAGFVRQEAERVRVLLRKLALT
ncbi:Bug family tripartite tricarboxylate transporter substrate binding protein [Ancylobacter sp. VNQ12]|uniref:Bug family tripartite tricarboxylate transporter substrate binding protein n=1 Tax=Ancylobacter sp. VNQ12 TaxID=3400920 RepID=UPI003C065B89